MENQFLKCTENGAPQTISSNRLIPTIIFFLYFMFRLTPSDVSYRYNSSQLYLAILRKYYCLAELPWYSCYLTHSQLLQIKNGIFF